MKYCESCRSTYPGTFNVCPKDQGALRSITELIPGLVLRGKYEIIGKLGAGGMGAVYKARHLAFGEIRAIKIIGSHLIEDEAYLTRFRSEAVLARKLQHPGIVRVEDFDATEDGRPFIVMEYVEGTSLRAVIREQGAVAAPRALDIAAQACAALAAAHNLGILHRDMKPDNIMLVRHPDGSEQVKIADFGLAKAVAGFQGPVDQVATSTGMMVGTPHYVAPEQAMVAKGAVLDGRVDLYALGIVLYEMLTGQVPFDSDTPMGIVLQHIQTPPVAPHHARPDKAIPADVSTLVMKALEKDPARRFKDAEQMRSALVAVGGMLPALEPAAPSPDRLTAPTVPVRPPRTPPPAVGAAPRQRTPPGFQMSERPAQESASGRGLLALGIAAVVVVVGVVALRPRPEPPTPAAAAATPAPVAVPANRATSPRDESGPDDETLRSEVQRLLFFSSALRDAHIDVAVANGIVTLTGEASNTTGQELAGSLASSVSGVHRVFNMVRVAASEPAATVPPARAEATAQAPPPPPPRENPDASRVRDLLEQARREMDARNPEAAKPLFEEVLRLDPDNRAARFGLDRIREGPPPGQPPPPR